MDENRDVASNPGPETGPGDEATIPSEGAADSRIGEGAGGSSPGMLDEGLAGAAGSTGAGGENQGGAGGENRGAAPDDPASRMRQRAVEALETGRTRLAAQIDTLGRRLDEQGRVLEGAGGVKGRAAPALQRAGGLAGEGADYLRTHEVGQMRTDLESQIRERPLLSVGIALGAGFLLARLLTRNE